MAEILPSQPVQLHGSGEAHFLPNSLGTTRQKEKKVRFQDNERIPSLANEISRIPVDGVILKDKKTGELLPFGEHQKVVDDTAVTPEVRLKGKLRWLFEQDRMFWESNDSKASSPKNSKEIVKPCANQEPKVKEVVCSRAAKSRDINKPHAVSKRGEGLWSSSFKMAPRIATLREDGQKEKGSFRIDKDRKKKQQQQSKQDHKSEEHEGHEHPRKNSNVDPEVHRDRECSSPNYSWEFRDATGWFDEVLGKERAVELSSSENNKPTKLISSREAFKNFCQGLDTNDDKLASDDIIWTSEKLRLSPDQKASTFSFKSSIQNDTHEPPKLLRLTEVLVSPLVEADVSELDLGGNDANATDYEDAAANSPLWSSEDDEDGTNERTKVGAAGYVEDVKDKNSLLKAKCNLLAKEKDIAIRKWKRSCVEIEQAAQMAQALRSAIETLLEVSTGSETTVDFKSKRTTLEEHTRALKARMEKLRRKSPSVHCHPEPEDSLKKPVVGSTVKKKTTEVPGLACPQVPRDTENKVEDLKARLEKLMLATNSRVTDDREQAISRTPEKKKKKKPLQDTLHGEKTELKMKDWFDSLSAELSADLTIDFVQPTRSIDKCDISSENGHHTREPSCNGTPATSKQVSPLHPSRQVEDTASVQSSEETKIRVIHKIAEEVRAESEQWYQVQELLQRVGEDMKRLQEACNTWERRALLAEAQVDTLLHEDQERKERLQTGDQKIAELQTEMVRLRDTVDEVRKQLGSVDPSRWFEAANKYGYAFVPVMRPTMIAGDYSFRDHADSEAWESRDDIVRRELRQKKAMDCHDLSSDHSGQQQPSCSAGSSIRERSSTVPARRDQKLPSSQWANEIAKAEEDEILQSKMLRGSHSHRTSSSELLVKSSDLEEDNTSPPEKHRESRHERSAKPPRLDTKFEDSMRDDLKEAVLPLSPVPKESTTDDLPRNANRSPLKVLGNVAPSKENKKPF